MDHMCILLYSADSLLIGTVSCGCGLLFGAAELILQYSSMHAL